MTATEQTLIGNDNSPVRVIADTLADVLHPDGDAITTPTSDAYRDLAKEVLTQLGEHYRIVPRIDYDANPHVRPYMRGGMIHRDAGDSNPEHTRFYAAQLLDAADKVEEEGR